MIFLIDDKKERQSKDYNWTSNKLKQFENVLKPIYSLKQIDEENLRDEIFKQGSIILLHESFFDNISNNHYLDSIEVRKKLDNYVLGKSGYVVYFSGSKSSRTNSEKIAHIPVSVLYQNLEVFIYKFSEGDINLDYILFGQNPKIEEDLTSKLIQANNDFDSTEIDSNSHNIIFETEGRQNIPVKISNTEKIKLFIGDEYDNQLTDSFFNHIIFSNLSETKYDNIFIPLCFGATLSDYNGLRLATLIRCTKTINQLSNIFIYGFVSADYFYDNEYFNILKTKNIELIEYRRQAFKETLEKEMAQLTIKELPREISKLNLEVPNNYEDNHSIANEFGIYQLAYNAEIKIDDITDFNKEKLNSTYFKWLIAKNGLYEDLPEKDSKENEIFRTEIQNIGLNIVGKIDLSKIPKR